MKESINWERLLLTTVATVSGSVSGVLIAEPNAGLAIRIAAVILAGIAGVASGKEFMTSSVQKREAKARASIAPKATLGGILLTLFVLLIGCGEKPPVVDAAALQRNVDSLDARASAVAMEAAELRPEIEFVCTVSAHACATVEAGYDGLDVSVEAAHKLIAILAEFGQGLDAARVAVEQAEKASKQLAALVASAVEVARGMVEPDRAAADAGEQAEGPAQAGGTAGAAADPADGAAGGGAPASSPSAPGQDAPGSAREVGATP